jgi:formylglycine-generating enzyme required for sulfatase activity
MSGNVAEWCSDKFDPDYQFTKEANPEGPAAGAWRMIRGGTWAGDTDILSFKIAMPNDRSGMIGFRLVLPAD